MRHLLLLFLLLASSLATAQSRVVLQSPITGYFGNYVESTPLAVLPVDTLTTLSVAGYYNAEGALVPAQMQPRLIRSGLNVVVHWDSSVVWLGLKPTRMPATGWYRIMANGQTIWNGGWSISLIGTAVSATPASIIGGINSQIAVLGDALNALRASTPTLAGYSSYTLATANTLTNLQNGKVDKVTGKALSTNDFSNTYKSNLDSLAYKLGLKSNIGHGHVIGDVSGLQTALDGKLNSADTIPLLRKSIYNYNRGLDTLNVLHRSIADVRYRRSGISLDYNTEISGKPTIPSSASDVGAVSLGTYNTNRTADLLAATNPANIVQNATYRFASDAEKAVWNGKANAFTTGNGLVLSAGVMRTDTALGVTHAYYDPIRIASQAKSTLHDSQITANTTAISTKSASITATTYANATSACAALPTGIAAIVIVTADESAGNAGTGTGGTNPTTYYLYFPSVGLIQQVTYPTN